MKAVIQRVTKGGVNVNGEIRMIERGYVLLLGVCEGDIEKDISILAEKTVNLRIMSDNEGKMNRSILDIEGEILVVSQFTLCADVTGGRRPSFIHAAKPDIANTFYMKFIETLKMLGVKRVVTGEFGADMLVEIHNDGPVTIIIDTKELLT